MNMNLKMYNICVNRIPGIRERYQQYRNSHPREKKILAWIYLMWLNVQYYILRNKKLKESTALYPDEGKKIIIGSESKRSVLQQPEALAEQLKDIDIISFDVFDTLILRKVSRPEDVFFLVQEKLNYLNLKGIRKDAEWKARAERYEQYGDYEVTLEEIWQKVEQMTGICAEKGIRIEWKSEQEVCFANPYFLALIELLKKQGKIVIVCSDMYLGEERIKELLGKCGYPAFERYFISSDYRKSKHNGSLYEIIRKEFGTELTYMQIGDNEYSDIQQAEKKKFQTIHYQNVQAAGAPYRAKDMSPVISSIYSGIINAFLHHGLCSYSQEFEFGFIYGGLFAVGYCQFIHRYVEENNIDKILFFSRDGDILMQVYEQLYPMERDKCRYAYWSRLSSTKLSVRVLKSHYIERMIRHKIGQGYTLADIFHTMELDDMLQDFLHQFRQEGYSAEHSFDERLAERLQEYIDLRWEIVCQHYDTQVEEGKKYYTSILENAKSAVAIDVGWVGSGAIILKKMIQEVWQLDCSICGILAGTCSGTGGDFESTAIELANGSLVSYLFSDSHNRDIWKIHDAAKGHNLVVELLLSSNEFSFRGFRRNENGEYDFNRKIEQINAAEIQRGILCFAEQYKKHPMGGLDISGRDAMAPIVLLYQNDAYVQKIIRQSEITANIE